MWTRNQVAPRAHSSYPSTPREFTSRTKQALQLEEWKDSRNWALNGIIELLNQPALNLHLQLIWLYFAKRYLLKQLRLGIYLYLGCWWTRMDWVIRQGGILSDFFFPPESSMCGWWVSWHISASSLWSLQTLELLNYLKSINVKMQS